MLHARRRAIWSVVLLLIFAVVVVLSIVAGKTLTAMTSPRMTLPVKYRCDEIAPSITDGSKGVAECMLGCKFDGMISTLQIESSGPISDPYRRFKGFLRASISKSEYERIVSQGGYLPVKQLDVLLQEAAALIYYGDPDAPKGWKAEAFRPSTVIVGGEYGEKAGHRFMTYHDGVLYWFGEMFEW